MLLRNCPLFGKDSDFKVGLRTAPYMVYGRDLMDVRWYRGQLQPSSRKVEIKRKPGMCKPAGYMLYI